MINSLNEIYLHADKPLSLKLEITNCCNLNCVHCYAMKGENVFLEKEYIFEMLRQAKKLGVIFLHITGGECTLHPDFINIYNYAYDLGFKIVVLTNGTNITEEMMDMFIIKRPYLVEISIYSLCAAVSEKVTGNKGSYKKTIINIKKLKNNNINLMLKYILMDINKDCYIPFLIFSKENNLPNKTYYNIMPTKNNKEWCELQLNQFTKELINYYTMGNYSEKMLTGTSKPNMDCNAGKTVLNINCLGELYYCDFLNTLKFKARDLKYAIKNLKNQIKEYESNINTEKCNQCAMATTCDMCLAILSDEKKYKEACMSAMYRYDIRKQVKELDEL